MALFRQWFRKSPAPERPRETSLSLASRIPDTYLPLWQLCKTRQLLEVRLGSAKLSYQSMIVALDIERGLLWLDELFPQQYLLEVGDELTLRHHRQGEQLLIRAQVLALGSSYGAKGIAIALPEQVAYTPRRSCARFRVTGDTPTLIKFRTLGEEPRYGTLQDISSGGLRLQVAGNLLAQLRHGAQLPLCEFELHAGLRLQCRARVCSFRLMREPHRCTQISLEFIDLPIDKRLAIEDYLLNAQRHSTAAGFQVA